MTDPLSRTSSEGAEISWQAREEHVAALDGAGFHAAARYIEALDDLRIDLETKLNPEPDPHRWGDS